MTCPCGLKLKKTNNKEVNENFNEVYFEFKCEDKNCLHFEFGIWEQGEAVQLDLFEEVTV